MTGQEPIGISRNYRVHNMASVAQAANGGAPVWTASQVQQMKNEDRKGDRVPRSLG
jgi:hypothetical protein